MRRSAERALLPAGLRDVLPPDAAFEAAVVKRPLACFAARILGIGRRTVLFHPEHVRAKLRAASPVRADLGRAATAPAGCAPWPGC